MKRYNRDVVAGLSPQAGFTWRAARNVATPGKPQMRRD
jgi:hypothetical protein